MATSTGPAVTRPRAIVVGAGVGGLVAALELAAQGLDVTVLEQAATPGGKMRQVVAGGLLADERSAALPVKPMDAGPTVFTMRWVFDALFAAVGERLDDHLQLRPLSVLARHAWGPGQQLDLHADIDHTVQAITAFSSAAEGARYRRFCQRAAGIYDALEQPFLRAQRPSPVSLLARGGRRGWNGLRGILAISPFATLWGELARDFKDPRLTQLFARYATYCGSSPWLAPATLMLVAHVERQGVWAVQGGMHRVAQCLAALAQRRGAVIRYGSAVHELLVERGRSTGVLLASGERLSADAVVFNGDVAALAAGRLGAAARVAVAARPLAARSLSALTWNACVPTSGFALLRHNVFFSADYAAEFKDLFALGRLPAQPTVYVCAQDRLDAATGADAPAAGQPERLLVLVNAPPNGDASAAGVQGKGLSMKELSACQDHSQALLQRCGLTLQLSGSVQTQPADFERLFPGTGGALYGQASHGWRASFQRPPSRSRLPGLYLAGGSTHPGPGVPMAALSGRLAVASLLADLGLARGQRHGSTPPWPQAATSGGTSTPSATMASRR